jgi:hypothetical protein
MKRVLIAILSGTALESWAQGIEDKPVVQDVEKAVLSEDFWSKGPEEERDFLRANRFRWTSPQKEALRSAASNLVFMGFPVAEAIIWMKAGTPQEVQLSLYNRGDCKAVGESGFLAMIQAAQKAITQRTQTVPTSSEPATLKGFPSKRQVWKSGGVAFVMEWDASIKKQEGSDFLAEFLRVRLLPQNGLTLSSQGQQVSTMALSRKTVTKTDQGDIYLADIPMVDQGPKGYCAVATTERVLRYYGAKVDQHQLAKIAETAEGTDPISLMKGLQRMSIELRVNIDVLEEISFAAFQKMVKGYNTSAKRAHRQEIILPTSGVISVNGVYSEMDPELLKDSKVRNKAGLDKFNDRIVQYINNRMPLVWGVMLGLFPEEKLAQAKGGHLRLIIGYNAKTKEVIYSDSWGSGHEFKRMPIEQAYTITTSLFSLRPK